MRAVCTWRATAACQLGPASGCAAPAHPTRVWRGGHRPDRRMRQSATIEIGATPRLAKTITRMPSSAAGTGADGLPSVRRPSRRAQSGTPAAKTDDEPAANSPASDTLLALAVTPSWGEVSRRRKRLLPVEAARRGDVARRDPSGNQVNDGPMGGSDRVDWTVAVFVQGCVGFRKSRIRLVRDKDASIRGLVWRSYRSS